MSEFSVNENGVPFYPKAHVGRLMVTLAAIDVLQVATVTSIAAYTGLSKGNIDKYVETLKDQLGVVIVKSDHNVYKILSWGEVLKESGVKRYLTGNV